MDFALGPYDDPYRNYRNDRLLDISYEEARDLSRFKAHNNIHTISSGDVLEYAVDTLSRCDIVDGDSYIEFRDRRSNKAYAIGKPLQAITETRERKAREGAAKVVAHYIKQLQLRK